MFSVFQIAHKRVLYFLFSLRTLPIFVCDYSPICCCFSAMLLGSFLILRPAVAQLSKNGPSFIQCCGSWRLWIMVARVNEYVQASTLSQRSNVELSKNGQQQNQVVSNKIAIRFCKYKYFEAAATPPPPPPPKKKKEKKEKKKKIFDEFGEHLRKQETLLPLQSSLSRCKRLHLVCVCPADKVNLSLSKVQLPGLRFKPPTGELWHKPPELRLHRLRNAVNVDEACSSPPHSITHCLTPGREAVSWC